jgi:hypothetical protein
MENKTGRRLYSGSFYFSQILDCRIPDFIRKFAALWICISPLEVVLKKSSVVQLSVTYKIQIVSWIYKPIHQWQKKQAL